MLRIIIYLCLILPFKTINLFSERPPFPKTANIHRTHRNKFKK
nr:MAG TPA: hypothetical protein [Inoviridae sp.]